MNQCLYPIVEVLPEFDFPSLHISQNNVVNSCVRSVTGTNLPTLTDVECRLKDRESEHVDAEKNFFLLLSLS